MMQYEWKITNLLPIETINTAWGERKKQTVVLEETRDVEYKWWIVVDLWWAKADLLSNSKVWDTITVHLNSKVREYNGKFYNAITGWKVVFGNKPTQEAPKEDELPF